jgi:dihydroorotase/N-acyl-D-amino-acid deacylase
MHLLVAVLLTSFIVSAQPFDLVVSGARVVDGTGNPWYRADVAIVGDRIAAIGKLGDAPAKQRIDVSGLVIAPGFIDIHSHTARDMVENPNLENVVRQGITTVLDGQDGGSPIPLRPFLDKVAARKPIVNFGWFVGHGSLRSEVMGLVNRPATPEELQRMRDLARDAMWDGAFGLSTGLFYVPGNYAPTEEVIEIAKVVGSLGGIHISHMRDEAAGVLDSVRETIRIGEEGGLPTQVTHHKIIGAGAWGKSAETLRLIEQARARGVDVSLDQYPYTASHTGSAAMFPQWSLEGGRKALLERLQAPESRARIKAEVARRLREDRGGGDPKNVQFNRCDFDPSLNGKTLADATARRGLPVSIENAAEVALELQVKGGCSTIYHAISEPDVERIMRYPGTMVATDGDAPLFGKGSPHPRSYGTFPRVLGVYVREKKLLSLEDAVRKMSSLPADRLKLLDRGVLRTGMKADIVIFDPEQIADKAQFTNPHQYSVGVRDVIVNGELILRDGKLTGIHSGRVLYGPARK